MEIGQLPQEPYTGINIPREEFTDNPDPRVPCVLLLDTSYSMSGSPISQLNSGIRDYREELLGDVIAKRRVEVSIVTFGGDVRVLQTFATASDFFPPQLEADGSTPMSESVLRAVELIEQRKATYSHQGIAHYRPWIFLITDGAPTDGADKWELACEAIRRGEELKKFVFFAVGTRDADFDKLREICAVREPLKLQGLKFRELFRWLSNSQIQVSHSNSNTTLQLPPTSGWTSIEV